MGRHQMTGIGDLPTPAALRGDLWPQTSFFPTLVAVLLLGFPSFAQEITRIDVDSGRTIDDAFFFSVGSGADTIHHVGLQYGRRIQISARERSAFKVVSVAEMPEDTFLWDIVPGAEGVGSIVAVGPSGISRVDLLPPDSPAAAKLFPTPIDLFRGRPTGPPLRYPLAVNRDPGVVDLLLPTLAGITRFSMKNAGAPEEIERVALTAKSAPRLGWGLGYRLEARLTPSFYAATDWNADRRPDLLMRGERSFVAVVEKDGRFQSAVPVAPAPSAESAKILDFDWRVAPLVGDIDGDGVVDWLLTDPGNGLLYVYFGHDRLAAATPRQPDQAMKESGWSIGRIVLDSDQDGRFDLLRLSVSQLNLLEQVQVLRKNVLPLRITLHPMTKDGIFAEKASTSMRVEMPIALSITRTKRTVNFRAPLVAGKDGAAMRIYGPGEKGGAAYRMSVDGAEEMKSIDLTVDRKSYYARPFDPPTADCNKDGVDDFLFLTKSPEDGRDGVFLILSGKP